jgi:hypothetical protein
LVVVDSERAGKSCHEFELLVTATSKKAAGITFSSEYPESTEEIIRRRCVAAYFVP